MATLAPSLLTRIPKKEPLSIILNAPTGTADALSAFLLARSLRPHYTIQVYDQVFFALEGVPTDKIMRLESAPAEFVSYDFINSFYRFAFMPKEGLVGTAKVREVVKADKVQGVDGSKTVVGVIDSGVEMLHGALMGKVVNDSTGFFPFARWYDCAGHGSHVCAIITGRPMTAPNGVMTQGVSNAQVVSIKALRSPLGIARCSDVLLAIEKLIKLYKAKIINMSLGHKAEDPPHLDPHCKAIAAATAKGHIFTVAAGNSGPADGTTESPGICPNAVTVGAWNMTDNSPSWFSSRGGGKPDIYAPGGGRRNETDEPQELIHAPSCFMSASQRKSGNWGIRPRNAFASMGGTSQAAPVVAGILALWNDKLGGNLTAAQAKAKFQGQLIDATWL